MTRASEAAYAALVQLGREQSLLQSCIALLEWDAETCLPAGGVPHRGEQVSLLTRLLHERLAAPRFGELIEQVATSALGADPAVAADLRLFRRRHQRATRMEPRLVEALAETQVLSQQAWEVARARDDFQTLRPWLGRIVELKRQEAAACAPQLDAYDALLDEHEPGARADALEPFFAAIAAATSPLVREIGAREKRRPRLPGRATPRQQRQLSEKVLQHLGFDLRASRLDTSAHPFTEWIGPGDVRMTTRFEAADLWRGLFATLHEVGHAFYDQSLDPGAYGRAAGEAASAALHEAQARLVENIVGRSEGFWRGFLPVARPIVRGFAGLSAGQVFRAINAVAPGEIRCTADELTYDLHIAVRFELERALISGALPVGELPAAWNEAYRQKLGVTPRGDAAGCLQDGHWAAGMFGYFPTYTLGNGIAAQLFRAAEEALGDQGACFARGDFAPLFGWLRAHVHRLGHSRSTAEIVMGASGKPLGPEALIGRLRDKARQLYGL